MHAPRAKLNDIEDMVWVECEPNNEASDMANLSLQGLNALAGIQNNP